MFEFMNWVFGWIFAIMALVAVAIIVGMSIVGLGLHLYYRVKIWFLKRDINSKIRSIEREMERTDRILRQHRPIAVQRNRALQPIQPRGISTTPFFMERPRHPSEQVILELDLTS